MSLGRDPINYSDGAARTPLHLLEPARAARRLLLHQLKRAEAAGRRLAGGEDATALHDFRVALRRFRAIERAHRAWVADALPKKLRRRLRELVRSTGPARDSEVQLQWLEAQRAALRPNQRTGYQWLRRRLEDRQRQGYAAIRATLPLQFASLSALLRAALTMPAETASTSFAEVGGEQLKPLAAVLAQRFASMADHEGMAAIHDARLLVKRVRYLLEPLAVAVPDGRQVVAELGGLQDLLGEMHDAEVLGVSLDEAAAEAGAARYRALVSEALGERRDDAFGPMARRRGDERAGLAALAQCVRAQMHSGRAGLLAKIHSGEVAALMQRLQWAAEMLLMLPQPPQSGAQQSLQNS